MTTVHHAVELALSSILADLGLSMPAKLLPCPKAELGDAAIASALQAARQLKRSPLSIAQDIATALLDVPQVATAEAVAPGYVNITFAGEAVAQAVATQSTDPDLGIRMTPVRERIVVDFGGPNIKPMHVGHLRSLVIGETLRRMLVAVGHDVVSDIHLGDWGLPSGMILAEIRHRMPNAPWFTDTPGAEYPQECPVTVADLATLYPDAAAACKAAEDRMTEARTMTAMLQAGDPGLNVLWSTIVATAKTGILATCDRLGAHFDLMLGESDAQPEIPAMIADLEAAGHARRENDVVLIDVAETADTHEIPPVILEKANGGALYATTDLATILMRKRDLGAERVLYVVDGRQALHFTQLFRAATKTGIAPDVSFHHVGFGTVNGTDGKALKTRAGNTMPLIDLLDLVRDKAQEKLVEGGRVTGLPADEMAVLADQIGLAALRIADLASNRETGYVLDIDRAVSFEGRTGPYLLYAAVRLRAIVEKAGDSAGAIQVTCPEERRLALAILGLGNAVERAVENLAPNELVSFAFDLANEVGRFYAKCPVLGAEDPAIRASRVQLCHAAAAVMEKTLHLLGCAIPRAM